MHRRAMSEKSADLAAAVPAIVPRLWRLGLYLTGNSRDAERLVLHACSGALSNVTPDGVDRPPLITLFSAIFACWKAEIEARQRYWHAIGVTCHQSYESATQEVAVDETEMASLQRLRTAVGQLPVNERAAMLLAYVEGFSHQEAADILGIALGTVTALLASARFKLGMQFDSCHGALASTAVRRFDSSPST